MHAIEDYAVVGDTQTAALVSRTGSVDWLCLPRFDSGACFAALLGNEEHGSWTIELEGGARPASRRYRSQTLVLETDLVGPDGLVRVVDFMPPRATRPDLVRVVEAIRGTARVQLDLRPRFDYGSIVPWVRSTEGGAVAIGGPDALVVEAPVPATVDGGDMRFSLDLAAGERVAFVLTWFPSAERPPAALDPERALADTEAWWQAWSERCTYAGDWRDAVIRSLVTLKTLTYAPTGGVVAALTTSLPEHIGGVRNWDYRFCWLRDATFTLYAFLSAGFVDEARAWRDWLLRAVAGDPEDFQLMYGVAGERRLPELELGWLSGYLGSRPVRTGNAASQQLQLDVFGELMDAMHHARRAGIDPDAEAWDLQRTLAEWLESGWRRPDSGIWEMRGPRRHFTHSKVMAWVAFDRAIKAVEDFNLPGPVDRWRRIAREVHAEVCERGYDTGRGAFVQAYDRQDLDASLLMIPLVGFLPIEDARVLGTIEAIERELGRDGLVLRYATNESSSEVDALPVGEGTFLACSFWLADNLALSGRRAEARALFERLLDLRNDVGLLAEQYDPDARRQLGNFPQALSHLALVNTALNLASARGPGEERGRDEEAASTRSGSAEQPPPQRV